MFASNNFFRSHYIATHPEKMRLNRPAETLIKQSAGILVTERPPPKPKRTKTDESGAESWAYPNGDFYRGSFAGNKRNGHGMYCFANGDRYEGEWKDNLIHGQGTFTQSRGDVYTGDFVAGRPHGRGVYYYHDGHISEGWWVRGKRSGYSKHTYHFPPDGKGEGGTESYEGGYRGGLRHGFGVYTYRNGDQEQGQWVNDKPDGEHVYFKQKSGVTRKTCRQWKGGKLVRGVRRAKNLFTPWKFKKEW